MKIFKYLQKTTRKGSFFVKFIKLYRFFQHSMYGLYLKKIGEYSAPPGNTRDVGYFDKNRLIHTDDRYRGYFNEHILYNGGKFTQMKPGVIHLTLIDETILLKKTFNGYQKFNKFYNELICLNRLIHIEEIPKIKYVDYTTRSIYMEFIQGVTLSTEKHGILKIAETNLQAFISELSKILNEVHASGVLMYDLKGTNMMKSDKHFHLIDFADSVYFGKRFERFMVSYLENEKKRLINELKALKTELAGSQVSN